MSEPVVVSIIVGLMVGAGVALIGAFAGHRLRLREMRAQWAEERLRMQAHLADEERKRRSDRRRELYEADLRIISDTVYVISEAVTGSMMAEEVKVRADLIEQAQAMLLKALFVAGAFVDEELTKGVSELVDAYGAWLYAIDLDTGKPKLGKEELRKTAPPIQKAASKVLRRIREILEEV